MISLFIGYILNSINESIRFNLEEEKMMKKVIKPKKKADMVAKPKATVSASHKHCHSTATHKSSIARSAYNWAFSSTTTCISRPVFIPKAMKDYYVSDPFEYDNYLYTPLKKITFKLSIPQDSPDLICAYSEDLKQSTWSENKVNLMRDIQEWIVYLWNFYSKKRDSQLTNDAIELRDTLKQLLQVAKCH